MHKSQQLSLRISGEGLFDFLGVNRISPAVLNHNRSRATALDIFFHASAKDAVLADDYCVTG